MAFPDTTVEYTSASSADTTSFSFSVPALWITCLGSGTVVMQDCTGTGSPPAGVSRTYNVSAGEILRGSWQSFTSTTCSRIIVTTAGQAVQPAPSFSSINGSTVPAGGSLTTGNVAQVSGAAALTYAPVNLAGGVNFVTGILPANNLAPWLDAGTIMTTAFTPTMMTMYPFNFQLTGNISFPKITAALNGQRMGFFNMGTGATIVIFLPSGTDSVGVTAAGVTALTGTLGSLKSQVYTANLTTGQWVPGV
jgi:hypothetical protein